MNKSKSTKRGKSQRSLTGYLLSGLAMLLLPPLSWLSRLFGIRLPIIKRPKVIHQLAGIFILLLIAFIGLLFWGGLKVIAILFLHTWATLIFSRNESFLKIHLGQWMQAFLAFLQLGFLIFLLIIDFSISFPIVISFLIIAKLSNLVLSEWMYLYTILLAQDRFDTYYWWKKRRSAKAWKKVFELLIKKHYEQSLVQIIWQFIKYYNQTKATKKYTKPVLYAWIQLRKYQILPDDLILLELKTSKDGNRQLQISSFICLAAQFDFMYFLIEKADQESSYQQLLDDFLTSLQELLEYFIQQPFKIIDGPFAKEGFIENLDQFLALQPSQISSPTSAEKLRYCFGLFYMIRGIAKNI